MKSAVVIPLTLLLAAGPWLCCCTAGHIAPSQPAPASIPHKASCCAPVSESPDNAPLTPPRSCSCQAEIQPATVAASSGLFLDMQFSLVLPIDCGVSVDLANSVNRANGSPPCSFLDSHDLLRVFHILRC